MTLVLFMFLGLLIAGLILIAFEKRNVSSRRLFLILFSLFGIVYYLYHWATKIMIPRDLLIILPLQLCDLAVFIMPIGLITGNRKIMDFLFYVCGLGALSAIVLMAMASQDAFYEMNPNFFFSHFAILLLPLLMIIWGMYSPKPSPKTALRLTITLMVLGAFMHGLNLFLNTAFQAESYYFFTIIKTGILVSPLLGLFAKIIPYDYFYLMLTFPILYLYMVLVYWVRRIIIKRPELKNSP